jgi:ligand-binding sensor domain-containing protein/signal transduction histidine kinase
LKIREICVICGSLTLRSPLTVVAAICAITAAAAPAAAQRLPVRSYDVADGLANSRVGDLYQDRRGYLWISTPEGLSRFDGAQFVTYGLADGLPHVVINAVTEDHRGRLWVGTNGGGLARLVEEDRDGTRPSDNARDRPFAAVRVSKTFGGQRVNSVVFDARGVAWCATDDGLYRGVEQRGTWTFTSVERRMEVTAAMPGLADRDGTIWFALQRDLVHVIGDTVTHEAVPGLPPTEEIFALGIEPDGGLLVGHARGLYRRDHQTGAWTRVPLALAPTQQIRALHATPDGSLWIGTTDGLIEWRDGRATPLGVVNGLPDPHLRAIVHDATGALWIGTWTRGVCRLVPRGVVSFTRADGLPGDTVTQVVPATDGRVYVASEPGGLAVIDGDRVRPVPGTEASPPAGVRRRIFQDSRGRWWIGRSDGVWLAPGPSLDLTRARRLGAAEGLADARIPDAQGPFAEDAAGRIWISALPHAIFVSGPDTLRFSRLPDLPNLYVRLTPDRRGVVWLSSLEQIGTISDDTFRLRRDLEGLPERRARAFFVDRQGRLWVGLRYEGLVVADDTAASPVRFRVAVPGDRLVSGSVWCITDDARGRLYLGTGRGLDRVDPATGVVQHLTTVEGLSARIVNACATDQRGHVWVATSAGVSRFDPDREPGEPDPPRVYLTGLTVAGEERLLAERGLDALPPLTLAASMDNLRVEFTGVRVGGGRLRYQYRLGGAEWSEPTDGRSVNFARLAPGGYRLAVRAVDVDGRPGSAMALLPFDVLTPIWRRWWVLALAGLAIGLVALGAHRFSLRQAVAMERVRGQIATDLHDEVGSGLAQITVLTEVARRDAPASTAPLLDESAGIARALRESMSDIVWAVDPRKDRLIDLVQRMRQTTFNLLEVDGREVVFDAPPTSALEGIGLAPDRRRHLLLILKEAVTNVARHAGATRASIRLELAGDTLTLSVEDDGCGPGTPRPEGRGLKNMAARADALGGRLTVEPRPGGGTVVRLEAPVAGPRPRMLV